MILDPMPIAQMRAHQRLKSGNAGGGPVVGVRGGKGFALGHQHHAQKRGNPSPQ